MDTQDTKPINSKGNYVKIFMLFFLVGSGCGWFAEDAIWQMVTNESVLQKGGAMFGTLSLVSGVASLVQCALYFFIFSLGFVKLSLKAQQYTTSALLVLSIVVVAQLAFTWDMGAPDYIMVLVSIVLGTLIANTTYFVVFPLITTYYGGWIIAPIRAGTDISSLVTSLLGEAQNPSGSKILFPTRGLLLSYAGMCSTGIIAWSVILHFRIGWKSEAEADAVDAEAAKGSGEGSDSTSTESSEASDGPELSKISTCRDWLLQQSRGLACPREFVVPILFAVLCEMSQWALLINFGPIGAKMTDPSGCDGTRGQFVYRTALTANRIVVPLGSVISSLASCPRLLFNIISIAQLVATALMCSAAFGLAQSFWTTAAGQICYIIVYAMIGGLEGYVLTMAYRYIGDSDVSRELQERSSQLLSFLGILAVTIPQLVLGFFVSNGVIACAPQ